MELNTPISRTGSPGSAPLAMSPARGRPAERCPAGLPRRGVKAQLFALFLLLLFAGAAAACPGCKEGLSSPENPAASAKLTKGWARSITLLMWTPYLLFGGAAFAIVRSTHRNKEKKP